MPERKTVSRVTIIIDNPDGSQTVYAGLQGKVGVDIGSYEATGPSWCYITINEMEQSFEGRKLAMVQNNPVYPPKEPLSQDDVYDIVKNTMNQIRKDDKNA